MRLFLILLFFSSCAFANNTLSQIDSIISHKTSKKMESNIQKKAYPTRYKMINSSVASLRRQCQFVLFYRLTCPHCRRFDPVISKYSLDSGIKVRAFTFGGVSSSFPNSQNVDPKLVASYFGQDKQIEVPTLFLLNQANGHVYPVSSGDLSYAELAMRMNELAPKILQHEGRGDA